MQIIFLFLHMAKRPHNPKQWHIVGAEWNPPRFLCQTASTEGKKKIRFHRGKQTKHKDASTQVIILLETSVRPTSSWEILLYLTTPKLVDWHVSVTRVSLILPVQLNLVIKYDMAYLHALSWWCWWGVQHVLLIVGKAKIPKETLMHKRKTREKKCQTLPLLPEQTNKSQSHHQKEQTEKKKKGIPNQDHPLVAA